MPPDPRQVAAMRDALLAEEATRRLSAYVEVMWPILEPTHAFLSAWHIDCVCEHLEAVTAGEIRRLVINLPPRYGKSYLVSVLWPTWEWIRRPSGRWMFASYSELLAAKHSLDRRRILRSGYYRRHWGHRVRLTRDQQTKLEFHNTQRGVMLATSMAGSITGKGGDRLVIDDPHSPELVESDTQRTRTIDRFRLGLATRLDDKARDAIVLVMQRLHMQDLTGVCLELGYTHVCLPALAHRRTTVVFPRSGRIVVRPPGAPLWPAREGHAQLKEQAEVLGRFGFAAQYQQEPVPRVGGYFPPDQWTYYDEAPAGGQILQSWDLSFKDSDGSDYVVGLVATRCGACVYVLDRFKDKVGFVETCHAVRRLRTRYPQTSVVLVEDSANGPAVIDTLRGDVPGLIAVTPEGGKQARAAASQIWLDAKQVRLPRPVAPDGTPRRDRAWVEGFIAVCAQFPNGTHDDDVDALTQLLVWATQHPAPSLASGLRPPTPRYRPRYTIFGRPGQRRPLQP